MFVDASALVAILTGESQRTDLLRCLGAAEAPITSGLAVFEPVTAVVRKTALTVAAAQQEVEAFIGVAGLTIPPITDVETRIALAAHARFGKGRHPARLNLGDCFAYACAKVRDVPLLFVGNDFSQTDIRPALG